MGAPRPRAHVGERAVGGTDGEQLRASPRRLMREREGSRRPTGLGDGDHQVQWTHPARKGRGVARRDGHRTVWLGQQVQDVRDDRGAADRRDEH